MADKKRPDWMTYKQWKHHWQRCKRARDRGEPEPSVDQPFQSHGGVRAAGVHLDSEFKNPEKAPKLDCDTRLAHAEEQIRLLQTECVRLKKMSVSHAVVRDEILKISHAKPPLPGWTTAKQTAAKAPGVPCLFASDWHWGEVVEAGQVGGVNAYDLATAHRRAKAMIQNATELLTRHMVNPKYPGIVFALGGDMFSGDIHEELSRTNEAPIMPLVLDLMGVLVECIQSLADTFGAVFVPCVTGNHSRTTMKMTSKNRNHLSFDWLLYSLLDKYFERDKRITFMIPEGTDAIFRIHNVTYCLTHGDQFRGGDGMIGALGPIIRGDHRKRGRNGQTGQSYDTLLLGHWHQLIQMQRLIVNGSLIGYNEYAASGNFGFEPPRQALWITHPEHGITFQMPVLVERGNPDTSKGWVSWQEVG